MTTTLSPESLALLERVTDPAVELLDQIETSLDSIQAALEFMTAKRTKKAADIDPEAWVEAELHDAGQAVELLRAHLGSRP